MELSKKTIIQIIGILAAAILLYCGIEHLDVVIAGVAVVFQLIFPFILGGAIAFILNVPMRWLESHLHFKSERMQKMRRGIAFVLTLVILIGIIVLALVVILPELGRTFSMLMNQIPIAFATVQTWAQGLSEENAALQEIYNELDIDLSAVSGTIVSFAKSVSSGLLSSGFGFFSGIISGVTTFVIALIFSIYVLFQKEKLGSQIRQIMYALLPDKVTEKILDICNLSNRIFSGFLSGQCLEATILGSIFVIVLSILRFPYAMLIGIVIALTALVPILGSFIGCAIGVFLIVMVNPIQAIWFIIIFLIIQQLEGNLIYPHVVGNSVGLPSIWVLVAVTVGGNLMGVIGMLVFIPLCSVLYALFRTFIKGRLKLRGVPVEKWEIKEQEKPQKTAPKQRTTRKGTIKDKKKR